jgi:hypothetical protein
MLRKFRIGFLTRAVLIDLRNRNLFRLHRARLAAARQRNTENASNDEEQNSSIHEDYPYEKKQNAMIAQLIPQLGASFVLA